MTLDKRIGIIEEAYGLIRENPTDLSRVNGFLADRWAEIGGIRYHIHIDPNSLEAKPTIVASDTPGLESIKAYAAKLHEMNGDTATPQ